MLPDLDVALREAADLQEQPCGMLRVSARRSVGLLHVVPAAAGFRAAFQQDEIGLGLAEKTELRPGDGDDTLFGGAGDDLVVGAGGADVIVGDRSGGGPDPVERSGTPGRNLLLGGDGNDTLRGGYGEDTAFGGEGDDAMVGWGFGPPSPSGAEAFEALDDADVLWGGAGDDSIRGGGGDDRIGGDAGADLFLFGREGIAGTDLAGGVGEGNRDVVTDFRPGEDLLDLSGYRSVFLPVGTPPPEFLGTDPFVPELRPQVRYEVEGGRTIVQVYSPFNAPPPEFPTPEPVASVEIELRGVHGISADDLLLG